ncbi:E3 ubiquitin-protein ligase Os03g0188200-like [Lolium perenne]|uniref:E3 ubiquitin-protein ligase Os03g0188200-like n=1 Tax=Lolium perenne TaxID=4522 RepID=UPI0021EA92EF|nr:E3 ubiquitin-protein ligase Os03g0188200-like [Lolium perenne]
MAPTPLSTTWIHRRRPFLRPLVLVLAGIQPASSQSIFPPPTDGATFIDALTPPPPPPAAAGGLGSGTFNVATSILFVGVIVALFLVGFFSAYLRRCADAATGGQRGRGGAANANAAVAAAAAAAFSSGVNRSRRNPGLGVAAMEALPVLTYARARAVKAGRGALECAVCLAEFAEDGEKLRLLPGCCHVFHAACIDVWLAAHVTCPVCRADLADPAVAAAGHVLAADLAAQEETSDHTVVNVEPSQTMAEEDTTSDQHQETAEERVDRFTLRLPERLRREIEEAKRLRRAMSAVTAATAASASSGRWVPSALRTMSAARSSRRWSALFRAMSGPRRSEVGGSDRRVAPLQSNAAGDNVELVVVQDDAGQTDKYYAHSLTFAGFVIDGDVAAGDWNPEVFQVSSTIPAAAASQR